MKKDFLTEFNNGLLIFDGAMGSKLISQGLDSGQAMRYNVKNSAVISSIHKSYVNAGAEVIYTNTFSANDFGIKDPKISVEHVIKSALKNAKNASKENTFILYSCGPLGKLMYPTGEMRFEHAYGYFLRQARAVNKLNDFDGVVLETFTDLSELRAAILAFKENTDLPILCSMSFDQNGRTFAGNNLETFARVVEGLGVNGIGLNCGLGADKTLVNAKKLAKYTSLPIFVKPNAGMPIYKDGKTEYTVTPKEFAEQIKQIVASVPGVHGVGGCCGTNEEFISELASTEFEICAKKREKVKPALCSGQKVVNFDKFLVVGERLNPTGKPALKKALMTFDFDYIYSLCSEQIAMGAKVLDVNVGMAESDELGLMGEIVEYLSGRISVPLCIDSTKPEVIECALRRACGIVLINSVNGDRNSLEKILPLARKYGACLIGLCLDEKGIPDSPEKRFDIAERIRKNAIGYGISEDRLYFDGLTMAISVNESNALKTLDTVKKLKNSGLKTILGLSNVSFGLPQRDRINSAFYYLAKQAGLSGAIVNPALSPSCDDEISKNAILAMDKNCSEYVATYSVEQKFLNKRVEHTIKECVYFGLSAEGLERIKERSNSSNYEQIINKDIIEALNELGNDFEKGKCFLPGLMSGADAARIMLDYLKENFMKGKNHEGASIILATVKGDIHDIGKNIVKAVLSNYGYNVIDLGRDVAPAIILDAIEEYTPSAVGLSALMTTTLDSMEETTSLIREKYPNLPILLGGAVVNSEFANRLGANYSENAQDCVNVLRRIGI